MKKSYTPKQKRALTLEKYLGCEYLLTTEFHNPLETFCVLTISLYSLKVKYPNKIAVINSTIF